MSEPECSTGRCGGFLAEVILLLFVAGLGAKAASGAAACRDLDTRDEFILYMLPASLAGTYEPTGEFAPLYVSWYVLLLRTGLPRDAVLDLNWTILTVLVPVSVYILARALGASRAAALVAAGGLIATKLIDVWPYPSHFVTIVLALGGTAGALAARRGYLAWAVTLAGLTLLTATYVRPEFLYSVYLFVPLAVSGAVWALVRRPEARGSVLVAAGALAGGAALLVWTFGSPISDGKRLPIAVAEHYGWNRSHHDLTVGTGPSWQLRWQTEFGGAESFGGMCRHNPGAILWHLGTNAQRLPVAVVETADPWVDVTHLRSVHAYPANLDRLPQRPFAVVLLVRAVIWGVVALGLFGAARALGAGHRGVLVGAGLLALATAPVVAASIVVYPRYHYLIPTVAFAVALAAAGVRHVPRFERWRESAPGVSAWPATLAAALALAAIVPNRADGWCVQSLLRGSNAVAQPPTPNRDTVRTLREVNSREGETVLTYIHAIPFYAGFQILDAPNAPGAGFLDCVRKTGARVVLIDPNMPRLVARWADDLDLRALVEGKESDLFRVVPVSGAPGYYVAMRR